jgi:hypothetical protein
MCCSSFPLQCFKLCGCSKCKFTKERSIWTDINHKPSSNVRFWFCVKWTFPVWTVLTYLHGLDCNCTFIDAKQKLHFGLYPFVCRSFGSETSRVLISTNWTWSPIYFWPYKILHNIMWSSTYSLSKHMHSTMRWIVVMSDCLSFKSIFGWMAAWV